MKEVAVEKALTFIEPGPVVLVTTRNEDKINVMTISWTMAIDFDQHIVLTTGCWNYSFDALMRTRECCVCIPPASIAETVVGIGMISGEDTDKFKKFNLSALKAKTVDAPLIGECMACLECRVSDYMERYGFVVLKVLRVVVNEDVEDRRILHAVGDGTFFADGEKINLREEMKAKLPPNL